MNAMPYLPPEQIRRYNSRLMELYSLYMNLIPNAIDPQEVRNLAKDCRIPVAEAFAYYFAALMGLDTRT